MERHPFFRRRARYRARAVAGRARFSRLAVLTAWLGAALSLPGATPPAAADPVFVPVFEGHLGTLPAVGDEHFNWTFFAGLTDVAYTLRITDTASGETADFEKDTFHDPSPMEVDERATSRTTVAKVTPPTSDEWLGSGDDIAGVFAYTEDGTAAETQGVVVAIVPSAPGEPDYVVLDDIPTFFFPDEGFNKASVATDGSGKITVAFTEFFGVSPNQVPRVRAQRMNGDGSLDGGFFDITDDLHTAPDVAILDPNGDTMVVSTIEFGPGVTRIEANIVDFTGPAPSVGPPSRSETRTPGSWRCPRVWVGR